MPDLSFIGNQRLPVDVEAACNLAEEAFHSYRQLRPQDRALFLDAIAKNLEGRSEEIVAVYQEESHLPEPRARGELARTTGQLRMFAQVALDDAWRDPRTETANPDRQPIPKPDMRSTWIPLGPVVVFGASNFPLAFSTAGGDTASALAAGCPVIVKGHPAHPRVSEVVAECILAAARETQMPEGVFSLLFDDGFEVGQALVRHPEVKAVGFTGSQRGGVALWRIAQERAEPIPVYAEMGSINPSFILPHRLTEDPDGVAKMMATGITMGTGQFCTNPGLIVTVGESGHFVDALTKSLSDYTPGEMLTPAIAEAHAHGVAARKSESNVETRTCEGAALFVTDAATFMNNERLHEELFGPSTLLVRCRDLREAEALAGTLQGQLTATLHGSPADLADARELFRILELKVGRMIVNQLPTGLEVCSATVHGGPFPATTDSRSTSVGSMAIQRWARPICYQNVPSELLPPNLAATMPI